MTESFQSILSQYGLPLELKGPWAIVNQNQSSHRVQGWKFHVSTIPIDSKTILQRLLPFLVKTNVNFKITKDVKTLQQLNEGSLGDTQIGKFMTIYPNDDGECKELAKELIRITKGFKGPKVITDMQLGDVVYSRFGGFNPIIIRDRLGQVKRKIESLSGQIISDEYLIPFKTPDGIENPFQDISCISQIESSKNGNLWGPGFLIVDILKSHPKGSVFIALDSRMLNVKGNKIKVIKEARKYCLSDEFGRDIKDRLKHQNRILKILNSKNYAPKVYDYFEIDDNGYLVIEFIEGKNIGEGYNAPFGLLPKHAQLKLLNEIRQLLMAIKDLHRLQYVHRDLTLNNIKLTPSGKIVLIDFELAYDLQDGNSHPYKMGTPGFMSPQQENEDFPPDFSDDIYSLGAIIASIFCGIDSRRLIYVNEDKRLDSIVQLSMCSLPIISACVGCLAANSKHRPKIDEMIASIDHSIDLIGESKFVKDGSSKTFGPKVSNLFLKKVLSGIINNTLKDSDSHLWLSQSLTSFHDQKQANNFDYQVFRSMSRGLSGILYIIAKCYKNGIEIEESRPIAEKICDWLLEHNPTQDDQLPGLHFGEAGVAIAISEAVTSGLISHGTWFNEYLFETFNVPIDWPDMTHGAAGQGLAAMYCADLTQNKQLENFAKKCAAYLLANQSKDGSWPWPDGVEEMADTEFIGFAHGTAGVVYFLIEYADRFNDQIAEQAWRHGIEWLLKVKTETADYLQWEMKVGDNNYWNWWCHGAAGIALTFLKAFEKTRNPEYSSVALKSLHFAPVEIRYSNLSQCHGLSGLGEIYLSAHSLLNDPSFEKKVDAILKTIMALAREDENDHCITWLVEDPFNPTADLMVGCSGIMHFLLDFKFKQKGGIYSPLLI